MKVSVTVCVRTASPATYNRFVFGCSMHHGDRFPASCFIVERIVQTSAVKMRMLYKKIFLPSLLFLVAVCEYVHVQDVVP